MFILCYYLWIPTNFIINLLFTNLIAHCDFFLFLILICHFQCFVRSFELKLATFNFLDLTFCCLTYFFIQNFQFFPNSYLSIDLFF